MYFKHAFKCNFWYTAIVYLESEYRPRLQVDPRLELNKHACVLVWRTYIVPIVAYHEHRDTYLNVP
jgi:hypothetical protein